ncbi:MAG: hypothetical protein V7695_13885 [Sulfitobacter sp.]
MTGISAADLAEDGFTGAPAITCEAPEVSEIWGNLGTHWRILERNFKAYPVCRWAHPPIEAALALARTYEFDLNEVEEIVVTTFHEATKLSTRRPMDGDAAQYSLPLTVAISLIHGTIRPEHMLIQNYDRPDIWRLVDKVSFVESDEYNAGFPQERFANVIIKLADGTTLKSETAVARGSFDAPLSDGEILEKLHHYAASVLSQSAQDKIARILTDPSNAASPAELVALLQPRPC